jgi:DNA invertase Pin-like site-specific DNA recombinase
MLTTTEDKGERGRFIPAKTKVREGRFVGGFGPPRSGTLFPLWEPCHARRDLPRVSTDDRGQDPENQLQDLRAWCAAAGHSVSREYIDYESGRKVADKRKQFAALFDDATKRKFDCVLFWALDRFSREGMAQTIIHLRRLSCYDIAFHSYTEPHLATDNELVRNVLLALLSSLAKVEAQKISERTKAGMARAQARGIRIGRPKLGLELRQKIAQRAAKGETAYSIAKALGIDRHTAVKYAG